MLISKIHLGSIVWMPKLVASSHPQYSGKNSTHAAHHKCLQLLQIQTYGLVAHQGFRLVFFNKKSIYPVWSLLSPKSHECSPVIHRCWNSWSTRWNWERIWGKVLRVHKTFLRRSAPIQPTHYLHCTMCALTTVIGFTYATKNPPLQT